MWGMKTEHCTEKNLPFVYVVIPVTGPAGRPDMAGKSNWHLSEQ
jgi:hypothetical protein